VTTKLTQVKKRIDFSEQVFGRDEGFEAEIVEQLILSRGQLAHHWQILAATFRALKFRKLQALFQQYLRIAARDSSRRYLYVYALGHDLPAGNLMSAS
jgi:hypothetical protein